MTFGEFFKQKRLALGLTLRAFCRDNDFDPGNVSKIERGRNSWKPRLATLKRYASALQLDDTDTKTFMTLAAIDAGRIPAPLTEKEFAAHLPLLFEIGESTTVEDLREFAEWLKERL